MSNIRENLVDVALGQTAPDILIRGGSLVNVITREVYQADISITGDRIAVVGDAQLKLDKNCRTINTDGKFLVPGFIDPHVHIESSAVTVTEYAKAVLSKGVTTVAEDPHEIANVLGLDGLKLMFDEAKTLPFNLLLRVPGRIPALSSSKETSGAAFSMEDTKVLLKWEEAVCLAGDINPGLILAKDSAQFEKIDYAIDLRKTVSGQSPGLSGGALNAFIAAGMEDSHVSENVAEIIDIVRHGMRALITHRPDLFGVDDYKELVKAIHELKLDTRYLLFCTDDIQPHILMENGHLDERLRLAIQNGLDPLTAIQMATINVADFLHIDRDYGSITPGKFADIVVMNDLETLSVDTVIVHGKLAIDNGTFVENGKRFKYPQWALETLHVPRKVTPQDFQIKSNSQTTEVKVRVIQPAFPKKQFVKTMPVINGVVCPDTGMDVLSIGVLERHKGTGSIGNGFLFGTGIEMGAIASTVSHDAHNIFVIGTNYADMATAANELLNINGGHAAVIDGQVIARVELPIAGLMSEEPIEDVARKFKAFELVCVEKMGCKIPRLLYMLNFICLPNIPHVGITDKGIINSDTMEIEDVIVSD